MHNSVSHHISPWQVQCLQWHPYEPELLVTADTDDTVKFWDVHVSEALLPTKRANVTAENVTRQSSRVK